MALPKLFIIKESEKEIKNLLKNPIPFIAQRLRVLLICKKNESTRISKKQLALLAGVDPNSVQRWRTLYINSGIEGLMEHQKLVLNPRFLQKLNTNF